MIAKGFTPENGVKVFAIMDRVPGRNQQPVRRGAEKGFAWAVTLGAGGRYIEGSWGRTRRGSGRPQLQGALSAGGVPSSRRGRYRSTQPGTTSGRPRRTSTSATMGPWLVSWSAPHSGPVRWNRSYASVSAPDRKSVV